MTEATSIREREEQVRREARPFDLAEEFFEFERTWLKERLGLYLGTERMIFTWSNGHRTSLSDFGRDSLGCTWGRSGGIQAWTKTLADHGVAMIPSKGSGPRTG